MSTCPTPGKRRWLDRESADEATASGSKHGLPLRPYHCVCGWWHHTSHVSKAERRKRLRLR